MIKSLESIQPINYQALEIDDFSGGITDNYLTGSFNKFKEGDNLLLIKYGDKAKLRLRNGSTLFDEDNPLLDPVADRTSALIYFSNAILGIVKNQVLYQNSGGTWVEMVGPNGGNSAFSTASDENSVISYARWQNQLLLSTDNYEYISKIYRNSANAYQIRTAGLPALASTPTVTHVNTGADSYLYRFIYQYTYLVGTVQYVDRGASVQYELTGAASVSTANANNITGIPVLANTTHDTLWDTTNIQVEIYRTTNGGVNFFLAKTVANGTTSTSDTMTDATLQNQQAMYTEGDVVENDPVPFAKLVHSVDDTSITYFAGIKDGTEIKDYQLMQSVPNDFDSVPADFSLDIGDNIVGMSSVLGRPILCCTRSVYRVDGAFDLLGAGGMIAKKISDQADCVSSQSVVQTLFGVFWCGSESFYYTDGYNVMRLNLEWPNRHKVFTDSAAKRKKIQGKYDKKNNRIWWTVFENDTSLDNDKCYVINLDFGINEQSAFTTISGGTSFRPTAIEFNEGDMYRGDSNNYLYIHNDEVPKIDPVKSLGTPVDEWIKQPIIYTYESSAFNMGSTQIRKASPRIVVSCKNESNLSLDIISINDDGKLTESLRPIRFRGSILWGDSDAEWGDPDQIWNADGIIEEQRRFPKNSYRYSFKQIKFSNAFVVVTSSNINGTALTNTTTKAVTLDGMTSTFPSLSPGYVIAFEIDDYEREFTVVSINSSNDSIIVSDPNDLLPDSGASPLQWVMRGYPKGEDFSLNSYEIDYTFLGKTQVFYRRNSTGEIS